MKRPPIDEIKERLIDIANGSLDECLTVAEQCALVEWIEVVEATLVEQAVEITIVAELRLIRQSIEEQKCKCDK